MAGHRKWRDLPAETMTPEQRARAQAYREALAAAAERLGPGGTDAEWEAAVAALERARLDAAAERLNAEAADVLGYQALGGGDCARDG